ncbi:bifunctional enoyl-CoA hydratase/phosphate acetyltransferase [Meridianimarinicoccus sp. MJW13]|uniref:bifunctional enoyl-CoA hydratase/phosphate acetyltransferase n=1 Tax=Meridianimarinicoccus sp. MJW13 TaxID=2720031 RepID=UPI0018680584|nr:bifunctional enoyl-CoA hydratase/phosphate acetyltransferase [Fluviibacterium sp. MJW13]
MKILRNTPFAQLSVGMEAETRRLCVADDLYVFAHASGNFNPLHLASEDGDGDGLPEAVAPGAWVGSLISAVLGNQLPGPGTVYLSQTHRFLGRAVAGDELIAKVRLTGKGDGNRVTFDTWVELPDGTRILDGQAEVIAPTGDISFDSADMPGLSVRRHKHFDKLLAEAEPLDPMPTAVVAPEEANSLGGALLAHEHTIIQPILIGDSVKIAAAAQELGADISGLEVIHVDTHRDAAALGVKLVLEGKVQALMKGHLHTDDLLRQVMKREGGLRIGRRLSHIFVMDVPGLEHLMFVTDAAINIAPDLETKVDIVQNAIDLARALGIETPKVGVLSAVETVTTKIPSTLDAAVLSKMADRGQIRGGMVDGPLAMDNAIDMGAARTKGIKSMVAGRAEILIAPNMESGNMLAKELTFVAHAEAGGIVVGARCPIILTSRSDDDKARLASCAIAALYAKRTAL